MSIPKGATLYNVYNQYYYRGTRPDLEVFMDGEWQPSVLEPCNDKFVPAANRVEQPAVARDDVEAMVAALRPLLDSTVYEGDVRLVCAAALDAGYRKFEIVEEDV